MIVLDEPWAWWRFIHLTDRADDGTITLYDGTVIEVEDDDALFDDGLDALEGAGPAPSLVVAGGSLRWSPGWAPGRHLGRGHPPRFRLRLQSADDAQEGPADGVLSLPTGELLASDASLRPWRQVTVPRGAHEVRVSTSDGDGLVVHEVALRPAPASRTGRPIAGAS